MAKSVKYKTGCKERMVAVNIKQNFSRVEMQHLMMSMVSIPSGLKTVLVNTFVCSCPINSELQHKYLNSVWQKTYVGPSKLLYLLLAFRFLLQKSRILIN